MTDKIKVLLVDDNEDLLETLSIILKRKGFEVTVATDGISAVDKWGQEDFDVVLMDIVMPDMNGFEAFKQIREMDSDASVILMTAYSDEDIMRSAVEKGVNRILNKPFDIDAVIETLRNLGADPPVLIVDDDDDILDTLSRTFDGRGYETVLTHSGEEAIELAADMPCRMAFVDIKLPGMDGLETFLRLKELRPDVTVILMTGFGDEVREALEKAQESDAVTCLFKPFDPDNAVELAWDAKKKARRKTHG